MSKQEKMNERSHLLNGPSYSQRNKLVSKVRFDRHYHHGAYKEKVNEVPSG